MILIDEIMEESIFSKLRNINIVNGYINDVSVLDAFVMHYAEDLKKSDNNLKFPCVFVQLDNENPTNKKNQREAHIDRSIKVIGAVSAQQKNLVNQNLNSLVKDVRKALYMDSFNNKEKAKDVILGGVRYDLPEKFDAYAYFELQITIQYVEKYFE